MGIAINSKLSVKNIIFLWLCLIGLVAHIFIDNIHQVEFWSIARQISENGRTHSLSELLEHEDDCVPFAFVFVDDLKIKTQKIALTHIPVFSISISPLLPPPKIS